MLATGAALASAAVVAPAHATTAVAAKPAVASSAAATSTVSKAKHYWTTHYCYGRTVSVDDGDTIEVKLTSHCFTWKPGKVLVIRNASIQATEIKHTWAPADCWSGEAWSLMRREFPMHSHVRLGAYAQTPSDVTTADGRHRYVMYAYSYQPHNPKGPWIDAQAALIADGLALIKGEHVESRHNIEYVRLTEQAMYEHKGMWGDASHCGTYAAGAQLQAWSGWKSNGPDTRSNANTEWFKVRNTGTVPVPLYGWQVRDGSHTFGAGKYMTFVIHDHVTLEPGQTMTLYPGAGTNNPSALVWYNHQTRLPFYPNAHAVAPTDANAGLTKTSENVSYGTYLIDPKGDFRAASVYPCLYKCAVPSLRITSIDPRGGATHDETVTVTNVGESTVDLTGDVVQTSAARHEFETGATLAPGESIVVHCDLGGRDTSTNAYFGARSTPMLSDAGGEVWLRTADAITMSMGRWGNGGTYRF